jgi:hypothetical protein
MDSVLLNRGEFGQFWYYPLAMQNVLKPGSDRTDHIVVTQQASTLCKEILVSFKTRYLIYLNVPYRARNLAPWISNFEISGP